MKIQRKIKYIMQHFWIWERYNIKWTEEDSGSLKSLETGFEIWLQILEAKWALRLKFLGACQEIKEPPKAWKTVTEWVKLFHINKNNRSDYMQNVQQINHFFSKLLYSDTAGRVY